LHAVPVQTAGKSWAIPLVVLQTVYFMELNESSTCVL
jgi:hypothetical protein